MGIFDKDAWIDEIKRWPRATIVGFVLGGTMTMVINHIGIPTLDLLPWPLTGLGYAIIFFAAGYAFVGLIYFIRVVAGGIPVPRWIWRFVHAGVPIPGGQLSDGKLPATADSIRIGATTTGAPHYSQADKDKIANLVEALKDVLNSLIDKALLEKNKPILDVEHNREKTTAGQQEQLRRAVNALNDFDVFLQEIDARLNALQTDYTLLLSKLLNPNPIGEFRKLIASLKSGMVVAIRQPENIDRKDLPSFWQRQYNDYESKFEELRKWTRNCRQQIEAVEREQLGR